MTCERTSFYSDYLKRVVTLLTDNGAVWELTLEERGHHDQTDNASAIVKACQAYLAGEHVNLQEYDIRLHGLTPFEHSVLAATREIPRGRVVTYAALADRVGRPRAGRAVGNALAKNPIPLFVPCHRVVGKEGIGGFSCGRDVKVRLLQLEGVLL